MKSLYVIAFALVVLSNCTPKETPPPAPLLPIPAANQLAWHQMELNAFVHFTTNTFTGKEWGYGDESPTILTPPITMLINGFLLSKKPASKV
jgi:alpha-L-fucosidase